MNVVRCFFVQPSLFHNSSTFSSVLVLITNGGVGMDAMFQVCKYCKHAKPTETDLLYYEIWKRKVCEHESCDGDSETI